MEKLDFFLSVDKITYFFALAVLPVCWYLLWRDVRVEGRRRFASMVFGLGLMTVYFWLQAAIVSWSWFMFPLHDQIGVSLLFFAPVLVIAAIVIGFFNVKYLSGQAVILAAAVYACWWGYVITHANI